MAGRYEELYRFPSATYTFGSPVIIEAGALQKDTQTGKVIGQVKLKNVSEGTIIAGKVFIRIREVNGTEIGDGFEFQYLDLKAGPGEPFGAKVPVAIPSDLARSFSAVCTEIVFADGTVWKEEAHEWEEIPKKREISAELIDEETKRQYEIEAEGNCSFVPFLWKDLFFCTCGEVSRGEKCLKCGRTSEKLLKIYAPEELKKKAEIRKKNEVYELAKVKMTGEKAESYEEAIRIFETIPGWKDTAELAETCRKKIGELKEKEAEEKKKAEEKAQAEKKKADETKKKAKTVAIIVAAVVLVAVLIVLAVKVVIPGVQYESAVKAFNAGNYEEAEATFVKLGDYKESKELVTACEEGIENREKEETYQAAVSLMESEKYEEAIKKFAEVSGYKDADDLAQKCREKVIETARKKAYDEATALFESGQYEKAAKGFAAITDYADSAELEDKSTYLYAKELLEEEKYKEAVEIFDSLGDYEDAKDLAREAEYHYGMECFDSADYKDAIDAFEYVGDYKDAGERLREAKYLYAVELTAESSWEEAVGYFGELGNYKDSEEQYKEACYQYGKELLEGKYYSGALEIFESGTLNGYKDSEEKINEAKYAYVQKFRNRSDENTYRYLKELKSIGYKDSAEIYQSLYGWTTTAVINNYETNKTTAKSSISKYDTVYCHFQVSGGGEPGSNGITLKAVATWPNGSTSSYVFDGKWDNGSSGDYRCWYTEPAKGAAGTLRIRFYNNDTGEQIGNYSVTLTD